MFKDYILNSIVKEMKICRRLATKIPADKMNFRSSEDTRSVGELLYYLSYIGTGIIRFWYRADESDMKTFFTALRAETPAIATPQEFVVAMDKQIKLITELFDKISDEDLHNKQITYPWGETATVGQALLETTLKWMTAYKLQLFSLIKQATGEKLGTPDAWRLTELVA
jgi:hypothetical protein